MSFLEAQQEILLDRVASVVENKIVLMSDVVLAANAVAAQQQINPNTNPVAYKKILESSRESMVEQLLIIEMACLLYTSPSPRDATLSRMPSSA